MDKSGIKNILFALGADLCGVASLDRFGMLQMDSILRM